ncbi:ATP-binding cassette domain-containing protein [Ochrobactrum oryzae]|nr:ATP-binding cassette domain-containing protein [Brucella oryzae]
MCVDDADRKTWDKAQLGETIGYLAQEIQLLPGTIAENIARFDPRATNDSIVSAACRAQAHKLILSLNDGYQTRIGKASVLSGERQRIGLARAFMVIREYLFSMRRTPISTAKEKRHSNGLWQMRATME